MNIFELEEALVKTIIRDTIETYSGQWRLIHEAVQNAHDAIQQNANVTEGSVEILFFVASNIVSVRDNGKGIAVDKYSNVFVIGGSDKTSVDLKKILKGSQGVGIKSTLYTSRFFKVDTIHDGHAWREAWNMLRRVVPLVVGQREGIDPADLIKWDKTEEFEHYKDGSNKLRSSSLFFKTTPREEQEVIALFFELLGRGQLKGYFPFRLGGKTIYDGLFYIDMKQGNTVPPKLKSFRAEACRVQT